jgi:hypothetical protein
MSMAHNAAGERSIDAVRPGRRLEPRRVIRRRDVGHRPQRDRQLPGPHRHARSSASSIGPPVRIFALASSIGSASTRVAASSLALGGRTRRDRPTVSCSSPAARSASPASGSPAARSGYGVCTEAEIRIAIRRLAPCAGRGAR